MTFQDLQLKPWIVKQLETIGLQKPTKIQEDCIPAILGGRDCIGCAKTGSGKTLAFALPILQTLSDDPYGIYALVLTPTRELAFQIADQFRVVGKPMGLRDCVVVGGRNMVMQGQELSKKPHVVIATPGRLADHLESCDTFSLKKICYLVLDEADRLLDSDNFQSQLSTIFAALPDKNRQTLLFSATLSDAVKKCASLANNPHYFGSQDSQEDSKTVDQLDQQYILTPIDARDAYLVFLIQQFTDRDPHGLAIVFTKTCRSCELLTMTLNRLGFRANSLHSMKPQKERMSSLAQFRSSQIKILIATDVASRGLDIPEVQLVVNHNVPSVTKDYVHRVGRTARAGRKGQALTLVTQTDVELLKAIEELIHVKLTEYQGVDDEKVAEIHVQVGVTKREQDIRLSEMDFDEKRNINKRKRLIQQGKDPDQEERSKQLAFRKRKRELRRERKQVKKQQANK